MDDRQRMAHLLRRAGFGAAPSELEDWLKLGFDAAVDKLLDVNSIDESNLEPPGFDPTAPLDVKTNQTRWLYRMIHTRRPLVEKMTFFWHGHFATSIEKVKSVVLMWDQNELFRQQGLGSFEDLLLGVSQDPAMLVWLDNAKSKKEAPNENYGRELQELFSLGVGNYTEVDVKAAAHAFTGWSIKIQQNAVVGDEDAKDPELTKGPAKTPAEKKAKRQARQQRDAEFVFRPRWHDDGEKTFLGQTGNWDGSDIVKIIVASDACARFISGKLFAFFVWDNPTDDQVAPFADLFKQTGGNIGQVVGAILRSDAFSSDEAYRAKIKSPVEFVAGTLRAAGGGAASNDLLRSLGRMGQTLFAPPNVGGWPSGLGWIGPSAMFERYNLVIALLGARQGTQMSQDGAPVDLAAMLLATKPNSADELVDNAVDWLLAGDLDQTQRDVLVSYVNQTPDGAPLSFDGQSDALLGKVRGLIRLITTTPAYQLA